VSYHGPRITRATVRHAHCISLFTGSSINAVPIRVEYTMTAKE
jgi:hypothetical protein